MLRYALDSLGWYEFEGLVQSLLKARIGLGVEAWGGAGDLGRDAWYQGALRYPTNDKQAGPFCFQCKFVDAANAAGARPDAAVLSAVRSESRCITLRPAANVRVYGLFTNACVGGTTRAAITKMINEALPSASVHIHDGNDLCAWLDNAAHVARRFPQLLGLRDLDLLLQTWVDRGILNRSREALHEADELARVFIPTLAYRRAVKVLDRHHFVILEGPPEMGKTAIGRMMALSMVANGWEALECRKPDEIERTASNRGRQVFFADDFFGRGEYEPGRVSAWEAALPTILRLLGRQRKLILTTRVHLLNLARLSLDLPGGAGRRFPSLGEVVVDAGDLQSEEKVRILYRHLKRAGFPPQVRQALRSCATRVVENQHFTPERIRRFVAESLPACIEANKGAVTTNHLVPLIDESLRNPTQGMRVSFRKLPSAHKWLLFALVESERGAGRPLRDAYLRLCPLADREPFEDVERALSHAFVKTSAEWEPRWVHPSCRDLTIQELVRDERLRRHFLCFCSPDGIALALSIGGGSRGEQALPLLLNTADWTTMADRALQLLDDDADHVITAVQGAFAVASAHGAESPQFTTFVLERFWPEATRRLNAQRAWTSRSLIAYLDARPRLPAHLVPESSALFELWKRQALGSMADPFTALLSGDLFGWTGSFSEFLPTPGHLREVASVALALAVPSPEDLLGGDPWPNDELSLCYSRLAVSYQKLAALLGGEHPTTAQLLNRSAQLEQWSGAVALSEEDYFDDYGDDYGSSDNDSDGDDGPSGGGGPDIFNDL